MKKYEIGQKVFLRSDLFSCKEISPLEIEEVYESFCVTHELGFRLDYDEVLPYPPEFTLDYRILDEEIEVFREFILEDKGIGLEIYPGSPGNTILRLVFINISDMFSFGIELGKFIQKNELNILEEKEKVRIANIEYFRNQNELAKANQIWNDWQEERFDRNPHNIK